MPPLICLSPTLLDQSFPRDAYEVDRIGIALGQIQLSLEQNLFHLIITAPLQEFVEAFEWERPELNDLYHNLQAIRDLLIQYVLQPHNRLIIVAAPLNLPFENHPVPEGCDNKGLVDDWAREVGKIYSIHAILSRHNEFFIGVACDRAFAGETIGTYDNPNNRSTLPLVGPATLHFLADAYSSSVPKAIRKKPVSFKDAYQNCSILGASEILPPSSGGSHYKVKFPKSSRPWPLDSNHKVVPEDYIRELVAITNFRFSLEEIIYILTNGRLPPPPRLRIWKYRA